MPLIIQPLTPENAAELSEIAMRAYFEHYRQDWFDFGEWYAHKSFNINQLRDELSDEKNLFFMAIYDGESVGYLKLRPDNQLADQAGNGFEIERIYLTKAAQGKGIGKFFIDFSMDMAKQQNKDYVWLKSKDTSKAKTFYERMGFQICATSRLDFELMKDEFRGMVTMIKRIAE